MYYIYDKVTIDLTHSHIEESEDRLEVNLTGGASSSSDAARALGGSANALFGGSSMMPGVPSTLPVSEDSKGKGKGRGGRWGGESGAAGKGSGKTKKEEEPCLAHTFVRQVYDS